MAELQTNQRAVGDQTTTQTPQSATQINNGVPATGVQPGTAAGLESPANSGAQVNTSPGLRLTNLPDYKNEARVGVSQPAALPPRPEVKPILFIMPGVLFVLAAVLFWMARRASQSDKKYN